MKAPNPRSILWKIALPQLALILILLLGLLLYLSDFLRSAYIDQLHGRLLAECRYVSLSVAAAESPDTTPSQLESLSKVVAGDLGLRVTIIAADGKVLADSEADPAAMENHLTRPEVQQAAAQGDGFSIRKSATIGVDTLYVARFLGNGPGAAGFVRLAMPLVEIDAAVGRVQAALISAMAAAGLLTLALSLWATRRTTSPLEELAEAARAVAAGNLGAAILPAGRDEIGQLAATFNGMTAQLRDQFAALQAERGKLAAVLAQMSDGVAILDPQENVALINPAAETIFGTSSDAALGRPAAEIFRHHLLIDLWHAVCESGEPDAVAVEMGLQNLFLQTVATPLGGTLTGSTLLIFQDLTRLRRLETVRRDFIANISHELRTPIASLQALAETLEEGALADPEAGRRFIGLMRMEIETLGQMVRELMELAEIESGRAAPNLRAADPAALAAEAVDRMRLQAERNNLRLENNCPAGLPAVRADPERIGQVLINLLHNAIKFTPPGGRIDLDARVEGADVVFAIRDTGVGISGEDLPRIFERFYKADRSRSGGGTGLGLAIARHILETHNGRIWAESTVGKGSTFHFSLPIVT